MSDVTGPIRTLPGAIHSVPEGAVCDEHPDRQAVARLQGETDSFGSEMHDLCQQCLDEHRQHRHEKRTDLCDWCKTPEAEDIRPHRDWEEGSCGPVYYVCARCRRAERERLDEEIQADNDYYEDWQ